MPHISLTTATISPTVARILKELGSNIAEHRKRLGLGQREFAEQIGIAALREPAPPSVTRNAHGSERCKISNSDGRTAAKGKTKGFPAKAKSSRAKRG
jgi:hypothetical protein